MPPNRFNFAHYAFSGKPNANDTLTFGLNSGPVTFQFVVNAPITTPEQIEVGDLSTAAEVAERTAEAINGSDLNQGWQASANGTHVHLTPAGGQPGSCGVSDSAANTTTNYDDPAPNGVIIHG